VVRVDINRLWTYAGKTMLVVHDLYPSKEALDAAVASGSTSGMPETLDQLDELLVSLGSGPVTK
jgi:hypothetical protein